jgi:hypothetical protein
VGEKLWDITAQIMSQLHLVQRLDCYLDKLEMETGIRTHRGAILRQTLHVFLELKGM